MDHKFRTAASSFTTVVYHDENFLLFYVRGARIIATKNDIRILARMDYYVVPTLLLLILRRTTTRAFGGCRDGERNGSERLYDKLNVARAARAFRLETKPLININNTRKM